MQIKHIIAAIAIMSPIAANAGLQVSARDADLGKQCFSEGDISRLIACDPNGSELDMQDWFNPCAAGPSGACYVGESNGIHYFCAGVSYPHEACQDCSFKVSNRSAWTRDSNNRVRATETNVFNPLDSVNYKCTATVSSVTTYYGCAAGYYTSGDAGANMTCTPCPNSGTSATGNTSKTGCYLPPGTGFSDDAGTGTVGDKCYWSE